MKGLELTLAIIKPNATKLPHAVQGIRNRIISSGFYVVRTKDVHLSMNEAQQFYIEHKQKFFYDRLTSFLSSGNIHVHILAGTNAIQMWRQLLGPTKVYQAKVENPTSIRALYGVTDTRNAAHGSDSLLESIDSAAKIGIVCPHIFQATIIVQGTYNGKYTRVII
ncbi:hypothetical protein J437_LFUL017739 [Ladona fulva]|uniref:Nucleoside diphosphate kinase-like domain-containing protein n=1 Tax=Ladona fulva TaxID=123851 RepID=A0A8K0PA02_LADFU|nr:hypothetical protein J437_LFUL017739 [Ladona fulva]